MPAKTDPKPPVSAVPKHSCCGGGHEGGTQTDTATHAGHDCCDDAQPSPAAQSSCCCDTNTASRATDAKIRSIAGK